MADGGKTIGEMSEQEARYTIWRSVREELGDEVLADLDVYRWPDGSGYRVLMHRNLDQMPHSLECADCGRAPAHNYHRPDEECEDKEAHLRDAPGVPHHPFLVPAPSPTNAEEGW